MNLFFTFSLVYISSTTVFGDFNSCRTCIKAGLIFTVKSSMTFACKADNSDSYLVAKTVRECLVIHKNLRAKNESIIPDNTHESFKTALIPAHLPSKSLNAKSDYPNNEKPANLDSYPGSSQQLNEQTVSSAVTKNATNSDDMEDVMEKIGTESTELPVKVLTHFENETLFEKATIVPPMDNKNTAKTHDHLSTQENVSKSEQIQNFQQQTIDKTLAVLPNKVPTTAQTTIPTVKIRPVLIDTMTTDVLHHANQNENENDPIGENVTIPQFAIENSVPSILIPLQNYENSSTSVSAVKPTSNTDKYVSDRITSTPSDSLAIMPNGSTPSIIVPSRVDTVIPERKQTKISCASVQKKCEKLYWTIRDLMNYTRNYAYSNWNELNPFSRKKGFRTFKSKAGMRKEDSANFYVCHVYKKVKRYGGDCFGEKILEWNKASPAREKQCMCKFVTIWFKKIGNPGISSAYPSSKLVFMSPLLLPLISV